MQKENISDQVSEEDCIHDITDLEREIYYTIRENFDFVVSMAEEIFGLKIVLSFAEDILKTYVASSVFQYFGATIYNIPWMFLYGWGAECCYGQMVSKNGPLYQMLQKRKEVNLLQYKSSNWYFVDKKNEISNIQFSLILHKKHIVHEKEQEEIRLVLSDTDPKGLPRKLDETILPISESRFPNLIHSEEAAKHRNQNLLAIAKRLMPDLDEKEKGEKYE